MYWHIALRLSPDQNQLCTRDGSIHAKFVQARNYLTLSYEYSYTTADILNQSTRAATERKMQLSRCHQSTGQATRQAKRPASRAVVCRAQMGVKNEQGASLASRVGASVAAVVASAAVLLDAGANPHGPEPGPRCGPRLLPPLCNLRTHTS